GGLEQATRGFARFTSVEGRWLLLQLAREARGGADERRRGEAAVARAALGAMILVCRAGDVPWGGLEQATRGFAGFTGVEGRWLLLLLVPGLERGADDFRRDDAAVARAAMVAMILVCRAGQVALGGLEQATRGFAGYTSVEGRWLLLQLARQARE